MSTITRRQFIELGGRFAVLMGLGTGAAPKLADALESLAQGRAPVLWLQAMSCSGCSVSLLNADRPGPAEILTRYISLHFHSTLSAATGAVAMRVINDSIQEGGYLLVVEGSIPVAMPKACMVGGEPISAQVLRAARRARAVICAGTCSSYGGIPAAESNPTGALAVPEFLAREGVDKPVIRLPGCPAHPDWMTGTMAHVLKFGLPDLDADNRPTMFFSRPVHDLCPRFPDYERQRFAATFAEDGCLFKLGCLGPVTHADCSLRLWNAGTSFCINANAPCIGCSAKTFASATAFPFYTKEPTVGKKGA